MKHSHLKKDITTVIAYSRLVVKKLDTGECIALHQWAQQNKQPILKLQLKFKQLLVEINAKKWEKPELRYDDNLYLYYYCEETLKWINTNLN